MDNTNTPCLCLTSEEIEWIRMAIKREARREKIWDAVLEKSIPSLVWAALVGLGTLAWNYLSSHWK